MTTVEKLAKALASVNEAIEELYYIDGMEEYAERLNYVAVEIEEELTELESLEGKEGLQRTSWPSLLTCLRSCWSRHCLKRIAPSYRLAASWALLTAESSATT